MKDFIENLITFIYSLSMGDYFFFIGTILLIGLFIYILYLLKYDEEDTTLEEDILNQDSFDISAVSEDLEKNYKPKAIKLTNYEAEQENNAIISYDELIKNKNNYQYNYDEEYEYELPELKVKKFDLNNTTEIPIQENKIEVKLMSYEREEEFLSALKKLQQNLSN